jgi:hypothetical protein
MKSRRPNFFIVGAPKAGSTALAHFLSQHPEACMSVPKEPHFFDAHYERGLDFYERCFPSLGPRHSALGEATPSYLMVPYVPSRLAKYHSAARIILLLRDPVERAFSSWWMLFARGMEPLAFEEALTAEVQQGGLFEREDFEDLWKLQVRSIHSGDALPIRTYLEGGMYAKHLRRYLDFFPRQNIHVVFSSRLRSDPKGVMRDLCRFLDISESFPEMDFRPINQAVGDRSVRFLRTLQRLNLMRFRFLLSEKRRNWLKETFLAPGGQPTIPSSVSSRLNNFFLEPNLDLQSLLQVDLSHWNSSN